MLIDRASCKAGCAPGIRVAIEAPALSQGHPSRLQCPLERGVGHWEETAVFQVVVPVHTVQLKDACEPFTAAKGPVLAKMWLEETSGKSSYSWCLLLFNNGIAKEGFENNRCPLA